LIRDTILYYASVAVGIGTVLLIFLWLRSRQGLALTAIRDSESAAGSIGINQQRTKLTVYLIAAFVAGLVGPLVVLEKLRITPAAAFSVNDWSADVIFIVIIGGIGTVEGPIVGTFIFFTLRFLLADYGAWYLITLGTVAIIVMLRAPRGVWGLIGDGFNIHPFPVQRNIRLSRERTSQSAPVDYNDAIDRRLHWRLMNGYSRFYDWFGTNMRLIGDHSNRLRRGVWTRTERWRRMAERISKR
jgi:hypothetical protein